jgi:S1-C subfamily serine protease
MKQCESNRLDKAKALVQSIQKGAAAMKRDSRRDVILSVDGKEVKRIERASGLY